MATKHVTNTGIASMPIDTYSQAAEPTLVSDHESCFWIDTDDSNRVYLVFRRGTGDQVKLELT